jgi:3',5'-cyclic AMP phosphodiesterase CpdA
VLAAAPRALAAGGTVDRRASLTIAHITDLHFGDSDVQRKGTRALFASIRGQRPRPDLLVFTGDIVDGEGDRGRANWDALGPVLAECTSTPYIYTLGNHDDGACSKPECMERMGMGRVGWASRQVGAWRFIALDSHATGGIGKLGEEQFAWLRAQLEDTPRSTPVCVLTHYPIMSVAALFDGINESDRGWTIPANWMHMDARTLKDLFYKHRNVTLCLSGHIHMHDRCDYLGVTYVCGRAASGAWWGGPYYEHPRGYSLFELSPDGGLSERVRTY